MQKVLHIKTTVLPGGRIEFSDQQLTAGDSVDVVVHHDSESERPSAVDVLSQAPGNLVFKDADSVDSYLRDERASWQL